MRVRYSAIDGELVLEHGHPCTRVDRDADAEIVTALTRAQLDGVLSLGHAPIDRCLAANSVPRSLLDGIGSVSGINNMRRIARQLSPALVGRAREARAPLLFLLRVCSRPREEQPTRWDELLNGASPCPSTDP